MKLYVLVRNDLSKSQQAVQAGHAVAEFLLEYPATAWDNGTLVYLRSDQYDIRDWIERSAKMDVPYSPFYEPDIGNEITSIAMLGIGDIPELMEEYRLV